MNHNHTATTPERRPTILVAVAIIVVLASLVVGARQLTTQLRGDDLAAVPAAGGGGVPDAPVAQPAGGASATAAPGSGGERPPVVRESGAPVGEGEPVRGTMTAGPVVADGTFTHTPQPSQVTIEPGPAAAARAIPRPPAEAPQDGGGPGPDTGGGEDADEGGPGPIGGSADDTADRPIDGTVDLTLGVRVETTGHIATVFAGVGGGLDGGLAELAVEFGDGESLRLSADQVAQLRQGGRVSVVHSYEPTLTPQPRTVVVTATDGAGQTHERTVRFDTRAAYRLSYSPLTVTALSKCDTFDAYGDFELTWRLDSRPARFSRFKLPRGWSYVEDRFQVGVSPVFYHEPPEFFEVTIEEKDPPGAGLLAVWRYRFGGAPGATSSFFSRGPVAQLGDHHYDVTMGVYAGAGWDDCHVRMEFTAYLTMIDSLERR